MKHRRSALGREKRRGMRSEAAARATAELKNTIQQSKSWMKDYYLQNLRGGEVWRAGKFTKPQAGATVEALTDRVKKQANSIAEKEEILRIESFPLNDGDQYYELPRLALTQERITEQTVERAQLSQSVKKIQSPDKQWFGAIPLLRKWNRTRIAGLQEATV
jgi:hypothetical protein